MLHALGQRSGDGEKIGEEGSEEREDENDDGEEKEGSGEGGRPRALRGRGEPRAAV